DFDLVVVSGDLTNEGADAELHNVHGILDGIRHPMAVVPGNHENNWSQSAGKTFVDLWGDDRFVTTVGDLSVVGINCGPYMKMGDGHIKQEDLHWLRHTLDSLCADPRRKILSVNHYPIRKDDLDNYRDYASLLEKYPVILHVNGHYHKWLPYRIGDISAVMLRALAMKDGSDGYSIIEIDPQWIHVYEKVLDQSPRPKYAYAVRTDHRTTSVEPTAECKADGFEITRLWADSASVFTRLGIDSERLYFGTSDGMAKAISRQDGKLLWQTAVGGSVYSRPVALGKGRVAIPYNSGIRIADASDGHTLKDLPSAKGPYVADGMLFGSTYLQGGYKRMEARDPRNGKVRWTFSDMDNYCQAAPAIAGDDIIFGAWDTRLRCISVADGKLRWEWTNGKSNNLFSPGNVVPAVSGDKVFIVAPDRYMTAIDRHSGKTIWRDNSHRYRESMGISSDGSRIYAKTMDGELVAVATDSDDFKELWTIDMGLGYDHAPCVIAEVDDVVYAGSRRGLLTAVDVSDPASPQILWSLPLGNSEINGIDTDGSDIYVSLIEGSVWNIRKH
ncbi:MAG: PQQ-binding-like beta-propeller repeat protein, partial [Muribaculaceae bacterium]|nr:PQQ-binding-like beta-propeller repeat protein [Muribaculaceae bacterium]